MSNRLTWHETLHLSSRLLSEWFPMHKHNREEVMKQLGELVDVVSHHLGEKQALEYFDAVLSRREEALEDEADAVLDEIIGAQREPAAPVVEPPAVNTLPASPVEGHEQTIVITSTDIGGIEPAAKTAVAILLNQVPNMEVPGPVQNSLRRYQVSRERWGRKALCLTELKIEEVPYVE